MSYFQTLQGFSDNARESQTHAEEFAKTLREEKVQSFKDKLNEQENNIEKWGGLVKGSSDAWHMGRKIMHHMKTMKKKGDIAKQEKAKATPEEQETNKATQEDTNPISNDEQAKPKQTNADEDSKNPFLDEEPQPTTQETNIDDAIRGPQPPSAEESNMDEGLEAFRNKAGSLGAKAEETEADTSELLDGTKSIISTGKETASKIAAGLGEKLGVDTGEEVGVGMLNAVSDAVPILGEIVGIGTLFAGLFHGIKDKKEEKREKTSSAVQSITGQASVSGGIDIKSVLGEGLQSRVGGLV